MAKQSRSWSWRHAIVKSGLPPTTRHVLLTISVFMNDAGDGCYPTTRQLAEATGLSERAVCEHIARSSRAGWLSISVHGFRGQKWKNHQYEAAWPEDDEPDPNDKKALTDGQHQGTELGSVALQEKALTEDQYACAKVLTVVQEGTDPNDKKALTDGQSTSPLTTPITNSMPERGSDAPPKTRGKRVEYPDLFEAFWKPYPRTPIMSKQEAFDAWKKLDAEDRSALVEATKEFAAYCKSHPDYPVIHACRFISKARFRNFAGVEPEAHREASEADWQKRLAFGREKRLWHVEAWGPFPGSSDCRVPEQFLQPSDGQGWAVWEA